MTGINAVYKNNRLPIAIITFQQAINYGAILQMYALQKAICSINYENEVLNYDSPAISKQYKTFIPDCLFNIKATINTILHLYIRWKRNKKFKSFIKSNIQISHLIQKEYLSEQEEKYSIFITGSDQVWNYNITNFDGSYFLDFVKNDKKKCSYAASFGIATIPNDKKAIYNNYLKKFNVISVREETGAAMVHDLTGRHALVDLDPVFLLKSTEWDVLCRDTVPDKYILVYTVGTPINVYQYTKNLARKTGLKIINIRYSLSLRNKTDDIGTCLYTVGPDEFINYIRNAEIVVTNSFHATAFSIIFNKDFFCEIPDNLGSRITDLLADLKINGRDFYNVNLLPIRKINWEPINDRLTLRRKLSMSHLQEILASGNE